MAGAPHHATPTYRRTAAIVRRLAAANPGTRCWRCGRTLAEHPPHATGKPATWTAGHVTDGQIDGELRPEASTCNFAAGGTRAGRLRIGATSRDW